MGTLKQIFNQYKWALLAGVVVAILIALITANIHVLQFMNYKMHNDVAGVQSIIAEQVKNEEVQDDWFFTQGMNYLLGQEEYSQELKKFLENEFGMFTVEWQKEIIKAYGRKRLNLPMSKEVMDVLIQNIEDMDIKSYVSRLSLNDFEQGLSFAYGNTPQVDGKLVDHLYNLLSIYPDKLQLTKFQFSLYDVLKYTGDNASEKIKLIFSKVDPTVAKQNLFKQLRNEEIKEERLLQWVEFFNSTGIIERDEYNEFKKNYDNLCLIRNQYNELDTEEIELKQNKEAVEKKIEDKNKALESKQAEMTPLKNKISEIEATLDSLVNSMYMSLYIEKPSGTGSNEYIASVPRNGLFGMKPSALKYIVKLTATSFVGDGAYNNLNLYLKGTKKGSDGNEYTYYVEVSNSDLANIENMKAERTSKINALDALKQEANQMASEIQKIKQEAKYDETVEALKNIASRRAEYSDKVEVEIKAIKELLGLNNIIIELKKTA